MLIRLFFNIWADIILKYREKHPTITEWQIRYLLLVYVSSLQSWIVRTILYIMELIGLIKIKMIEINILPTERLNDGLSFFVMFVSPFILLNYFTIFWRKRYVKIIDIYVTEKGNYGDIFVDTGLIFIAIVVFGHGIISGNLFKW